MGRSVTERPDRGAGRTPDIGSGCAESQIIGDAGDASWAGLDVPPWHLGRYTVGVLLNPDGTTVGEHKPRPRWFVPHPAGPVVGAGSAQTPDGVR